MTPKSLLHATMLLALSTGLACTATVGSDEADELDDSALGSVCTDKVLNVSTQGRENRYGITENGQSRQVALNPGIPIQQICNQIRDAQCRAVCDEKQKDANANGVRGFQDSDPARLLAMGRLADDFNAAMGNDTNFGDGAGGENGGNAGNGGGGQAAQCNAKALQVIIQGKEHRFGFDNRQVALNPAIPMQNICQQVSSACTQSCFAARDVAIAFSESNNAKGFSGDVGDKFERLARMGKLADDFNRANGVTTSFADDFPAPGGGDNAGGGNAGGGQAAKCQAKRDLQVIVKGKEHRYGFDGRQVALNPAIPMQNICNDFGNDQTCKSACQAASQTALGLFDGNVKGVSGDLSGQAQKQKLFEMGTVADTFNRLNGRKTNFADGAIFQ